MASTDRRAWVRELLDQWEGKLVRYAARITGDVETAKDVVQDTFLRLVAQPRDKVEGHEAEWLFAVCRNRALDVRKKEGRMTELSEVELATRQSQEPPPGRAAEVSDQHQRVLSLVGGLSPNQREVVRLKFQDGLSYREIAKITHLTETNVGFLLHTAIKQLRNQLGVGTTGLAAQA